MATAAPRNGTGNAERKKGGGRREMGEER